MANRRQVKPASQAFVVDGARTPFLKARGKPGPFSASDLAVAAGRAVLARCSFAPTVIDELILGCAMPGPDEANIGRIVALRLGLGNRTPGYTVMRNCASGMQALDSAARNIWLGRSDLVLAGGTEAMSRAPVLFNEYMVSWLAELQRAKSPLDKAANVLKLRPAHFTPVLSLVRGLTDPVVGLNMGQTCEVIAQRFDVDRKSMDAFAARSHRRLAAAYDEGRMDEVAALYDPSGRAIEEDDGLRRDTSEEKLATLKPFFDRKVGQVTAGNSSQVTDGAALLLVASERAVEEHDLPVLGVIEDCEWAALDPAEMGLGPVHASAPLMKRHGLPLEQVNYWEINEAFAGQVLACIEAFDDAEYCRDELGLTEKVGRISDDRLNLDGGAVAIGHPVGASGARIVLHALKVLERQGGGTAVATICIGGGQGGAMLLKRTAE